MVTIPVGDVPRGGDDGDDPVGAGDDDPVGDVPRSDNGTTPLVAYLVVETMVTTPLVAYLVVVTMVTAPMMMTHSGVVTVVT